ncbi:hypothetical protein KUL72_02365 [Bradyrhizobium arachidis]|uniref:hypothetical protein n=1 Tax=Bradyrhizobium TaxID=374 RepID=UPI0021617F20|nr:MULTISPECIES: hypothetical protein [Bradyrhizobium]MDN4986614.1 hypothetical protein [Bradyrhizobium sp. WYCCWR 13022]UVO37268.1 hypothetical protein KUL72_02365 [Bradyrhizobium arachidis]
MADSEMLRAAKAEVERWEAELSKTEAFQKLQLAKQVVSLYEGTPTVTFKIAGKVAGPSEVVERLHDDQRRSLTTKTARIEAAAAKYLEKKGARAPASELLVAVESAGIPVGGREPVKALSSYLSGSKAFNNQRELGGYGLAAWGVSRGPDLLSSAGDVDLE